MTTSLRFAASDETTTGDETNRRNVIEEGEKEETTNTLDDTSRREGSENLAAVSRHRIDAATIRHRTDAAASRHRAAIIVVTVSRHRAATSHDYVATITIATTSASVQNELDPIASHRRATTGSGTQVTTVNTQARQRQRRRRADNRSCGVSR